MNLNELKRELETVKREHIDTLEDLILRSKQVIILGNGGSNAIASHISQDYTKRLKVPSYTFSDPSRLTCYINDYGHEFAYVQFLNEYADEGTLVILISSSGESANIYNCAKYCHQTKTKFVTLTGFECNNRIKEEYAPESEISFWVNSRDYGVVECIHQIILHAVV